MNPHGLSPVSFGLLRRGHVEDNHRLRAGHVLLQDDARVCGTEKRRVLLPVHGHVEKPRKGNLLTVPFDRIARQVLPVPVEDPPVQETDCRHRPVPRWIVDHLVDGQVYMLLGQPDARPSQLGPGCIDKVRKRQALITEVPFDLWILPQLLDRQRKIFP